MASLRFTNDNNAVYDLYMATPTERLSIAVGIVSANHNLYIGGGEVTSTTGDLYLYNTGNFFLNSKIVDNSPSSAVRFIKSGGGNLFLSQPSTHTGGTVANAGTITLNAALKSDPMPLLPVGNIVLSAATISEANFGGQFPASSQTNVSMSGNSTINLIGGTTIGSLAMNSIGGGYTTFNVNGTLYINGDVSAKVDSIASQPVIQNGILDLGGVTREFNVTEIEHVPQGMRLEVVVRNGNIVKKGNAPLSFGNYGNTFGDLTVEEGTIIVAGAVNGTGVLGGGTITLAGGTGIMTGDGGGNNINGALVYNPVNLGGAINLGQGPYGGGFSRGDDYRGNISLIGQINLTANATLTTNSPFITNYLGVIHDLPGNAYGITKNGDSTLVLWGQGNTDYHGRTTINGGVLRLDYPYVTSPNSMMSIGAGAFLNINNQTTFMGGLDGAGTLTNSANAVTTVYIGGTDGNFGGQISTYNNSQLNIVKVGTGYQTFNGTAGGNLGLTIVDGQFIPGAGKLVPTWPAITLMNFQTGGHGILNLENGAQTLNNRVIFGGPLSVPTSEGEIQLNGNELTFNTADVDFVTYYAAGAPGAAAISGPGQVVLTAGTGYRRMTVEKSSSIPSTASELTISANLVPTSTTANTTLLKYGGGAVTLSGTNTYVGQTRIDGGTIRVAGGAAIPDNSQLNLNGQNLTTIQGNAIFNVLESETIGSITSSGPGIGSAFYNLIQIADGQTLSFGADGVANTYYNGRLSGGPTSTLTKVGSANQYINGPMAYGFSGTVRINSGTLTMAGNNAMPYMSTLSVYSPGTFSTGGVNTIVSSLGAGNGTITGGGGTLTVGYGDASSTFQGIFAAGALNMAKMGTGTLTLSTTNTAAVTGSFTVNDGTLLLTKAGTDQGSMNFANTVINSGGTVTLDNTDGKLAGGRLSGKAVTLSGGRLNLIAGTDSPTNELVSTVTIGWGRASSF